MSVKKVELGALEQQIQAQSERKQPPVHLWKPDFCGDLDMQITRDGRWIHEGGEIKRPAMVAMFSSILWREDDQYFLVTPVEKVGIQVEDVPFLFTGLEVEQDAGNQRLIFTAVSGDVVVADQDHPLRVEINPKTGEPSPYLMVRYGMEGRLHRNVFYQLAELAREENGQLIVESAGQQFVLG